MRQINETHGMHAPSRAGVGWFLLAGLMIFLVSVLMFADASAQSLSFSDQRVLLEGIAPPAQHGETLLAVELTKADREGTGQQAVAH